MSNRAGPRILQVVALMVLAAISAESVAGYDATTGRPLELGLGILFLTPLYGGPAVLIREAARRARLGWRAMVPMAAAFGLLEAGVIDQSLFSADYRGIEGWEQLLGGTFIEPLGLSAYLAETFVVGHVIYSFCAPIAIVEALRPAEAHQPWLRWPGLMVVVVLYLVVAAVVLGDHGALDATWLGVAQASAILALGAALLVCASRRSGWGLEHIAAVAAGALLTLMAAISALAIRRTRRSAAAMTSA
jgi:hypothetical protein